jgi:hypothetical protein
VPWCEDCNKFWNPPSMKPGGECPGCGRVIAKPQRAPWHFKLLLGATAVYLGWRLVQGVEWVAHRF